MERLREKINSGKLKEHFTKTTSMIEEAPEVITKKLDDYQDVQIFTEMFLGSDKQRFEVIFDSGSNWFWVKS